MGSGRMRKWKRVLPFFLIILLISGRIPLTSYAADKSRYILLEVEEIAPREGIQGQKSIFTITARDFSGNYLSQIPIIFYVDGKKIEEKVTNQAGDINFSFQFLSAGKYNIGFSSNEKEYESNYIEMTYTVKEVSTMQFTCQNVVTYGSSMVLSTTGKEGVVEYKIVAGNGAAYITDTLLTATKVGTVTVQAILKNETGQNVDQVEMNFEILPKEVTFTAEISDKIYTGTNDAAYNQISNLEGIIEGDEVTLLPGCPFFESSDAGRDKKIKIEGAALEGKDAINYKILPPDNLSASIKKRVVTIKDTDIADKKYDGTIQASFKKTPVIENLCEIDKNKVELILPKIQYKSAEVGEKKEIIVTSSFQLKGENAVNYELEQPAPLFGNIKKAGLIVTADNKKRAYGSENPTFTYTIKGFVKGESEEVIKGFQKPKLFCHADKKSKPGNYAIQIRGGYPGKNYEFQQYRNGTMTILKEEEAGSSVEKEYVVPIKGVHYKVSKPTGKNQWFIQGNFQITPRLESGFDKIGISPSGPWLNELNYRQDTKKRSITFYLKNTTTGEQSKAKVEEYRMDKKKPQVSYEILTASGEKATEKKHTAFGRVYEAGCYLEINTVDAISGIDNIKYYTVDANTGRKSAIHTERTNRVQIPLPHRFKGYVYVIASDYAGNSVTVGTDGIIITEEWNGSWNEDELKEKEERKKPDTTAPVIKISYNDTASNGIYYNTSRTAKIQILEYDLGNTSIKIKKDQKEIKKPITITKGKKVYKDKKKNPYYIYTAYIRFEESGRYTLDINCRDNAGNKNQGLIYPEGSNALKFIIDKDTPTINFRQIKAHHSYNGDVQPSFVLKDKNIDSSSLSYSLQTMQGEIMIGGKMVTYPGGYLYVLDKIPKEKRYDNNYILTVSVKDKAGNKVSSSIPFRVNREGSHYTVDSYTKKINHSYIKEVSDIVLIESNLDRLKEESICVFLNYNGIAYPLEQSKDYTITQFGNGTGYYQYMYILSKELFKQNGTYRIVLTSKDKAGNNNYNATNPNEAVYFSIDKTYPALIQSNLTNGSVYFAKEYKVKISLKDNIKLSQISIRLNGATLKKKVSNDNKITFSLKKEDVREQKVEIIAKDTAGNKIAFSYQVYVTQNPFVWLLKANVSRKVKFLFLLSFLIFCFFIATLLFLFMYYLRQRNRKE